jgi:hypothetical protein
VFDKFHYDHDPYITNGYGGECGRYDTPPIYNPVTYYLTGQDNTVTGYDILYGGSVSITPLLPTCAQPWNATSYLLYPSQTCAVYPPQGRYRLVNGSATAYLFVPAATSGEFSNFAAYAPGVTSTAY